MSLHLDLNKNMYANIEAFLLHQEIAFSKITFNMIKFSQMSKLFQEYGFKTGKINFIDICGKVDFNHKKIYSNGDITLGGYILLTAANFERPCKTCENGHNS